MRKIWFAIFAIALIAVACQPAAKEGIEARDYWLRASAAGENTAMYMLLQNHGSAVDELIGASSNVTDAVELHKTTMDANGMMQMSPVPSVVLDADAEVHFEPGGLHVMFIGLKQDLKVGDKIQVTLHFKNREDIVLTVPAQEEAGGMHMP